MDQYGMWVWINTYENTIFRGMNIHFNPAILMWTEGVLLVLTHCHVITFHHQTLFDLIYQNQVYRLNQESFWRVYKIPSRMKTEWDMDMESTWINHVYIYIHMIWEDLNTWNPAFLRWQSARSRGDFWTTGDPMRFSKTLILGTHIYWYELYFSLIRSIYIHILFIDATVPVIS
jgi:hypothetical protein